MKQTFIKAFFFISILSSSVFAQDQDFDESFLKSLPDEVRDNLLNESKMKADASEIQYRRPSTYIQKNNVASNRFGSMIFSMMQSTLMPLNEPNFDGSYILDYGDVLELQLVGQKSSSSKLLIKRDGSINIKDIGKIFLSGLSLDKAIDLIQAKINISYIGVDAYVTLINVRDIQVIVAGNVSNPGPYTLNGNSNIFHALSISGGPSNGGSFRSIDLIRNNKIISSIDLYQTFIYGKPDFKMRLRSGDLIFIRPASRLVTLEGGLKRPGVYELTKGEYLSDAVYFANGVSVKADLSNITLFRLNNGNVEQQSIKNSTTLSNIETQDGDKLVIREYPYRTISISGAVVNPGSYIMNQGDGILELILKAGGYQNTAYPFGGVLENETTKKINQMAMDELYNSILDNISLTSSSSATSDSTAMLSLMQEIKNRPAAGRVSAEFDLVTLKANPEADVILQEGDKVTIPEFLNQVYIYGEVSNEGSIHHEVGKSFEYYLNKKGGLKKFADKKAIFILYPNGETIRAKKNRNIFVNEGKKIEIYPGTIIFIPRKVNSNLAITKQLQAYAGILGNIGISLASVSVLKD